MSLNAEVLARALNDITREIVQQIDGPWRAAHGNPGGKMTYPHWEELTEPVRERRREVARRLLQRFDIRFKKTKTQKRGNDDGTADQSADRVPHDHQGD